MRKKNYTAIVEFEVTKPLTEFESVGEKLSLSRFGEFCPPNSLRGYSLLALLDYPENYRISKIVMKGTRYTIPKDRKPFRKPQGQTTVPQPRNYYTPINL